MPVINTQIVETINITENGQYDVAKYTSANVNVQSGGGTTLSKQYTLDANNVLSLPSTFIDLTGATDLGDYTLYAAYAGNPNITDTMDLSNLTAISGKSACESLFSNSLSNDWEMGGESESEPIVVITGINLHNVESITGDNACKNMCYQCANLTDVDLSSLRSITGNNTCNYMFYQCNSLVSVDLSSLEEILGSSCCSCMFYQCANLQSVDLSGLTTVGDFTGEAYGQSCGSMFQDCTNLTGNIDLSNLTEVISNSEYGYHLAWMFMNCTNVTGIDLSGLTTIHGGNNFSGIIYNTSVTSLSFDSLTDLGTSKALSYLCDCARSLTSVSFPALTANSFNGVKCQFESMLGNTSGITLHFPSNLSSIIPTLSGYPNFGGTDTVILYDL